MHISRRGVTTMHISRERYPGVYSRRGVTTVVQQQERCHNGGTTAGERYPGQEQQERGTQGRNSRRGVTVRYINVRRGVTVRYINVKRDGTGREERRGGTGREEEGGGISRPVTPGYYMPFLTDSSLHSWVDLSAELMLLGVYTVSVRGLVSVNNALGSVLPVYPG